MLKKLFILLLLPISLTVYGQDQIVSYIPENLLNIKSFQVDKTANKLVMMVYPSPDISVFDLLTGRELARLSGNSLLPEKVYYDGLKDRIIGQYSDSIHVWNANTYEKLHSFVKPNSISEDFNQTTETLVFMMAEGIQLINPYTSKVKNLPALGKRTNYSYGDKVKLSPDGSILYELIGGELFSRYLGDLENITEFPGESVLEFSVFDASVVTLTYTKTSEGSPVRLQFFATNGLPTGEIIQPKNVYQVYGSAMHHFSDQVILYSSYNAIEMIDANGGEYKFSFKENVMGFELIPGLGFVVNFGKRVDVLDFEGRLLSRVYAKGIYHSSGYLDEENDNYLQVSENGLIFQNVYKPVKGTPKEINSPIVNQMSGNQDIVVFATRNGEIQVWNTKNGRKRLSIEIGREFPSFLGISTKKQWIAAVLRDLKLLRIYSMTNGKILTELPLSEVPTSFKLDDEWMAVGYESGKLTSWKLEGELPVLKLSEEILFQTPLTGIEFGKDLAYVSSAGRIVRTSLDPARSVEEQVLIGHSSYIHALGIDREGKFLASSSLDGSTHLWDIENGHLLESIVTDSAWVNRIDLYDSLVILSYGPGMVSSTIYNPALYEKMNNPNPELLIQTSNTNGVPKVVFSPDGKLVANSDGNKIRVREVRTGFMITEMTTTNGVVNDIEFDNRGSSIIVATGTGIEYMDPFTGQSKKIMDLSLQNRSIHEIEVFPKRNLVFATNRHGWHYPIIFHQNSGQNYGVFNYNPGAEKDDQILNLKISPGEKYLATYGKQFIKIFSPDDGGNFRQLLAIPREIPDIYNEYWIDLLSFSADDRYLSFVEFTSPNTVKVYDIENRKFIFEESGKLNLFTGNSTLLKMSSDTNLDEVDILSDQSNELRSENEHLSLIQSLAFDPNQRLAASSDIWGNLKLWDLTSRKTLAEIERFNNDTYTAEISPDGKFLAYNNKQGIFLFNLKELSTIDLEGSNYPYFGAFSNDNSSFFFRREKDIWKYDLASGGQSRVIESTIPKDKAGSFYLSNDDRLLLFADNETDDYHIYDLLEGVKKYTVDKSAVGNYTSFSISRVDGENNRLLGIGITRESDEQLSLVLIEYNLKNGKTQELSAKRYQKIEDMDGWDGISLRYNSRISTLSPDLTEYAFLEDYHLKIQDRITGEIVYDQYNRELKTATYTKNGNHLILASEDGKVKVFTGGIETQNFIGASGMIGSMDVRGRFVLILGADDKINVFDAENEFKKIYSCSFVGDGEFVIANELGYYYASKGAIKSVAFKKGSEVYPFEQFDLFYNRPDLAVKNLVALGITDNNLAKAFERAYKKRLKKTGYTEENISSSFHLPELELNTEALPASTDQDKIQFTATAKDNTYRIDRVNIWVNDVPIYGSSGRKISPSSDFSEELEISLSEGFNKVQVSVSNEKGVESLKRTFVIEYAGRTRVPNLYIVSIGASEYKNTDFNLKYAAKDAIDLAEYTESSLGDRYGEVHKILLVNEDVTIENVKKVKDQLLNTEAQDVVIVFYAGHGLLDAELDYYFATFSINFMDPSENGLAYEDLEGLLDGIPARKKLLLIDACHSGEIDKEEIVQTTEKVEKGSVMFRGFDGYEMKKGELGLENSFELMQMMFADLRRGTGAMVISSAGGVEVALEGDVWNNGVFTYSLIDGLKSGDCDLNNDGEINISELREYVIKRVEELTKGQQNPTSRKENLEFDFSIW